MGSTVPLCTECGKHPAMTRSTGRIVNGKCKTCMGRMLRESRTSKRANSVNLDFSQNLELLRRIQTMAKEEYRTPEAQILYALKNGLCALSKS